MLIIQLGIPATSCARWARENDLGCGFQSPFPSGTRSSTRRVVAVSWSNSGRRDLPMVMERSVQEGDGSTPEGGRFARRIQAVTPRRMALGTHPHLISFSATRARRPIDE